MLRQRQGDDAAEAEAIVSAAQRPGMRFVEPKSTEQQSSTILFRARERLIHKRTELVNTFRLSSTIRPCCSAGIRQLTGIREILDEPNSDLLK